MLLTLVVPFREPAETFTGLREEAALRGAGGDAAVATEPPLPTVVAAHARVEGRSGSHMTGTVTFQPEEPGHAAPLSVTIELVDAAPGNHAVFLHEKGDCSASDATSAAGWFGPGPGARPGSPGTGSVGESGAGGPPPGYLGFVTVGVDGRGAKDLVLRAYTLGEGPASLVDRAVVVYERAPDFTRGDLPGARQACGVIKRV